MPVTLHVGIALHAIDIFDDATIRAQRSVQPRTAAPVAKLPVLLDTLSIKPLAALGFSILLADVLQALHAHTGDLQQDAARPARHVNGWAPATVASVVVDVVIFWPG